MAEQLLYGFEVRTTIKEMGCEGVAEGVAGDAFGEAGADRGQFYGALDGGFVEVVAAFMSAAAP